MQVDEEGDNAQRDKAREGKDRAPFSPGSSRCAWPAVKPYLEKKKKEEEEEKEKRRKRRKRRRGDEPRLVTHQSRNDGVKKKKDEKRKWERSARNAREKKILICPPLQVFYPSYSWPSIPRNFKTLML